MPISPEKLANVRSFYKELRSPNRDGYTSNAPLLLVVETTNKCNFKCAHCARALADQIPVEISAEVFQRVIPALPKALDVYLFGDGEVLLNLPRHLAMIAGIHQQDPSCALGFSTNGKLLTPDVYELYSIAGIQYIQISVDAATKELYETMRRGGSFDELILNLEGIAAVRRRWKARHPQLHLATVISRQNYRELPLLAKFAKKYEFSRWYINVECPLVPGRDQLELTPEDVLELTRMRAHLIENYSSYYLGVSPVLTQTVKTLPAVR
jgi:MoaA/NifB/PqqE/SkfB family radical SAM enzyme